MPLTVRQVEEEMVRRIEALNPAGTASIDTYKQAQAPARWSQVRQAGTTPISSGERAHLAFDCFVESSPVYQGNRGTPGEFQMVRSRANVMFTYHLRASQAVDDRRLALDAAHDIVRAMNDYPRSDWMVDLVDAGRIAVTDTDRPLLVVLVIFDISHEIGV